PARAAAVQHPRGDARYVRHRDRRGAGVPVQPDLTRTALVLGGTGYVGSAVLRELARRGVPTTFTYHRGEDKAHALAAEYGHTAVRVDLADPAATRALPAADVVIHCAAVSSDDWAASFAINVESAHALARAVAERGRPADIVL